MRKAYIQPEAELLSLALLEDFLTGSSDNPGDESEKPEKVGDSSDPNQGGANDSMLGNGGTEDGDENGYEGAGKWV